MRTENVKVEIQEIVFPKGDKAFVIHWFKRSFFHCEMCKNPATHSLTLQDPSRGLDAHLFKSHGCDAHPLTPPTTTMQ